jgi:mRNA interferase MazF
VIARGDVRWFRFGSPDKRRPVLVLGRQDVLPSLSQIPIIPLSTTSRGLRWEVALGQEDGLPSACVLKPEWIRIVDRSHSVH